jgi:SAM-dependent methyltransferase
MKGKVKMIRRSCPVCSSRDESKVFAEENFAPAKLDAFAFSSRKIPEHMHYRLVACPVCGLLYSTPLPTRNALSKGYEGAAFDASEESRYAARTYGRFLNPIRKKIPEARGALDIGTGDGAFLGELLKRGFTGVVGVEPSKAPVAASPRDIRPLIRNKPFDPRDFKAESFNLVSCFQTFEHLYDPLELCRSAHRLLKSGGAFLVVSHNRLSLSARILGLKSPIYDIEHLQLFSPRSIRYLFEKTGFERVRVQSILNRYPLHYWVKLLPFPRKVKLALMALLKKTGIGYIPIPLPAGNMAVIGYKGKG